MINTVHSPTSLLQIAQARESRVIASEQKDARAGVNKGIQPQNTETVSANVENRAIQKKMDKQQVLMAVAPREGLRDTAEAMLKAQQKREDLAFKPSALVNAYKEAAKLKQTETAAMPDSAKAINRRESDGLGAVQGSTLPDYIQNSNDALNNSMAKVSATETHRIEQEAQSANGNDSLAREQSRLDARREAYSKEPKSQTSVDRSA